MIHAGSGGGSGHPVRLIDAGWVSPARSQALYHALAEAMDEHSPDTIVLCRPTAPYLSVGYHQAPAAELDLEWCAAQGYPVFHRRIGGGTVLLDPDQIFYQCIVHRHRAPLMVDAIYRTFLGPPVDALRALGVPASLEAVNEIEVHGRRIAGTGGGQIGEAMVVVGNLLLDFPVTTMSRAWRVPSSAFRRLAEEGLRRHVATLRGLLGTPPAEATIRDGLVAAYQSGLDRDLVPGSLSREEESAITTAEAWLERSVSVAREGRSSSARLKLTRRAWVQEWTWTVDSEEARVTARLADGHIEDIALSGGALGRAEAARRIVESLATGTRGCA